MGVLTIPTLDAPALQRYGLPEYVTRPSPAAQGNFSEEIDGRFHVRLLTVYCRFVTDANVANRTVNLEYRDNQDQRFAIFGAPNLTQTASTTTDYFWSAWQGQADWPMDSTVCMPLAPIILPPTFDFRIVLGSAAAGDQLSRIRIYWERFFNEGQPPG